jgi:hypothetical protein
MSTASGPVGQAVKRTAVNTASEAQKLAEGELGNHPGDKARTGNYAQGFKTKARRGAGNRVGYVVNNSLSYAWILERGSRSHLIRARRSRNLVFVDRNGQLRIEKVVQHPGTPAYRILERAAKIAVKK